MLRALEFAILAVSAIVFLGLVLSRPRRQADALSEEHPPVGAKGWKAK
jgi:hypothetical protein